MNYNFEKYNLDFIQKRRLYFLISLALIAVGLVIMLAAGLNLGVDFVGGTRLDILIDKPFTVDELSALLKEAGHEPGEIILVGNNKEIAAVSFAGTKSKEEIEVIKQALSTKYGANDFSLSETTVSATAARDLAKKGIYAVLLALVGIIIYVTFRFEYRFGVASIIALIHDALIMIAAFAILRLEVDITFIAAVLTIIGYSINNTIVIFDRIRENMRLLRSKTEEDLAILVNTSITETLPRTINTTLTVIFPALLLFLIGGESIRNFSLALLIGLVAGTYSNIFIASQLWISMKMKEMKKKLVNA